MNLIIFNKAGIYNIFIKTALIFLSFLIISSSAAEEDLQFNNLTTITPRSKLESRQISNISKASKKQNLEEPFFEEEDAEKTRAGFCREQKIFEQIPGPQRHCDTLNYHYLKYFFSFFITIGFGAGVRTIIRLLELPLPYTVVLLVAGLLFGLLSRIDAICTEWVMYTRITRVSPKILLHIFLPCLIFESAFNMKTHIFLRSISQILLLALPGMLISTFLTALVCHEFLLKYEWTFAEASLFGSIISATDPVAVVSILKELGTSEILSTIIEGESLLNDGVAILLYEVFNEIVEADFEKKGRDENLGLKIFIQFLRIVVGGPIFGYLTGKISLFFLSKIFNDAIAEISITLCAAYITYFVGEEYLGVSGVIAVVALGLTMSAGKSAISPEVEDYAHEFWGMLAYIANTVLFVIVGVVITETAATSIGDTDIYYLIFLYLTLTIIRLLMLLVMSPFLSRIGYGMSWQYMIVIMWGALRGAVGIALALQVFKNKAFCSKVTLGPKFLLQTAGVVLLTLIVNGTTTKKLLDILRITELSLGRLQDMMNAMRIVHDTRFRIISMMKQDRFFADANWDIIERYTNLQNPYRKQYVQKEKKIKKIIKQKEKEKNKEGSGPSLISAKLEKELEVIQAPGASKEVVNFEDFKALTEEARLRVLKTMKVSFWRQFEEGVLTTVALDLLINLTQVIEDRPLTMIHVADLKKYWQIKGVFPWIQKKIAAYFGQADSIPDPPEKEWKLPFYYLTTWKWFDPMITLIVMLNLIPIIWEMVYDLMEHNSLSSRDKWTFLIINIVFTSIYLLEFLVKIIGRGCKDYWTAKWNYIDFLVLLASIIDIVVSLIYVGQEVKGGSTSILKIIKIVRIARIARSLKLIKPLLPKINKFLEKRIHQELFVGYDIAKGFLQAADEAIKFLPQIIDNPKIIQKIKHVLEYERLEVIREMSLIQKSFIGIAVAVKTRQASRTVLNQMRECLLELRDDGLVDIIESDKLAQAIEHKMKMLVHTPPNIQPSPPEILLTHIGWIQGSDEILQYVYNNATLMNFAYGEKIVQAGDAPDGIYIVVSGLCKIKFEPTRQMIREYRRRGIIPGLEFFPNLTLSEATEDYFGGGLVIGEISYLTKQNRACTIMCVTGVLCYYLTRDVLDEAIKKFNDPYDSLESRMWRTIGTRLGTSLLPDHPLYVNWSLEKIKIHLERSSVPIGEQFEDTFIIPNWIHEIILIFGQMSNLETKEVYTAPTLIPRNCTKLQQIANVKHKGRILLIAFDDIDYNINEPTSIGEIQKIILSGNPKQNVKPELRPRVMRTRSKLSVHQDKADKPKPNG